MRFASLYAFSLDTADRQLQKTGERLQAEYGFEFVFMSQFSQDEMIYGGVTHDLTLAEALLHPFEFVRLTAQDYKDNWKMDYVVVDQELNGQGEFEWNEETRQIFENG